MLTEFLSHGAFTFFLLFCRIGAVLMVMPGIGESFISTRARLLTGIGLTAIFTPLLQPALPRMPAEPLDLMVLVSKEIIIGLFIGLLVRIAVAAMHTAGHIIAYQAGLASAMVTDVTNTGQSTIIANFMGLGGLALFFAADLHHLALRAMFESYTWLAPGAILPAEDMAKTMTLAVNKAFAIGFQLSSPHIVIGLIIYLTAGILSRLMPAIQILPVLMGPQITLSLLLLMICMGVIGTVYLDYIRSTLGQMSGM